MTATGNAGAGPDALMPWDDVLAGFDPVLGLEVHVELSTATKMFYPASPRS